MTDVRADFPSILLVEDEASHAEIVRRSLARQHAAHRLVHVSDGEQALEYLQREADAGRGLCSPHVVLLDLQLPKLGGLDVLKAIRGREAWRSLPVIVLSTSGAASDLVSAYRHGANSYVVKPLDVEGFDRLLSALGRFWLDWNRRPGALQA